VVVLARWVGVRPGGYHRPVGRAKPSRRPVRRFLERFLLGALMSVVAFVVERRLLKAVRKRGETRATADREGGLAAAPHQVDHQG
jgi:hypothetical protein